MSTAPYTLALAQMHAATVLFGLSAILGKLIESSSSALVCGRALFAVGSIGLLCLIRRTAPWQNLSARTLVGLVLSGGLLTAHYVTFFIGIKLGGVAVGTLGFACFPAFVTLFESLAFREHPKAREYVLILLVSIGLILITPSFFLADQGTEGLLWGVGSGAIYAVLAVCNRFSASRVSGVQAAWWQNLTILICLTPFAGAELLCASALDWLWIACLGIVCTGMAYTLYVTSLTVLKARLAALIIALEPVYSILMAWIVFHDVPGLRTICGGLLILGAVILAGRR